MDSTEPNSLTFQDSYLLTLLEYVVIQIISYEYYDIVVYCTCQMLYQNIIGCLSLRQYQEEEEENS